MTTALIAELAKLNAVLTRYWSNKNSFFVPAQHKNLARKAPEQNQVLLK